jgi:hypothetical protein
MPLMLTNMLRLLKVAADSLCQLHGSLGSGHHTNILAGSSLSSIIIALATPPSPRNLIADAWAEAVSL